MFLLNSRPGLFSAAFRSSRSESLHPRRPPFSQSYGVNLPSSLARVLSTTLGLLPQPTGVGLRYGCPISNNEGFLGSVGSAELPRVAPQLPPPLSLSQGGFASPSTYGQGRTMSNRYARPTFLRAPKFSETRQCWNINQLSIAYGFRPRLRPD